MRFHEAKQKEKRESSSENEQDSNTAKSTSAQSSQPTPQTQRYWRLFNNLSDSQKYRLEHPCSHYQGQNSDHLCFLCQSDVLTQNGFHIQAFEGHQKKAESDLQSLNGEIAGFSMKVSDHLQNFEVVSFVCKVGNISKVYHAWISTYQCESFTHEQQTDAYGSSGKVYFEQFSGQQFCIKCLPIRLDPSNKLSDIEKAVQEFMIADICSILEIGPKIHRPYFFDFYIHESCFEFCMEKCEKFDCAIDIGENELSTQLCDNILKLHSLQIVHLDIKPFNVVFCRKRKRLLFIDFGLSKWIPEKVGQKSYTKFLGTFDYAGKQMKRLIGSAEKKSNWIDLYANDLQMIQNTIQKLVFNNQQKVQKPIYVQQMLQKDYDQQYEKLQFDNFDPQIDSQAQLESSYRRNFYPEELEEAFANLTKTTKQFILMLKGNIFKSNQIDPINPEHSTRNSIDFYPETICHFKDDDEEGSIICAEVIFFCLKLISGNRLILLVQSLFKEQMLYKNMFYVLLQNKNSCENETFARFQVPDLKVFAEEAVKNAKKRHFFSKIIPKDRASERSESLLHQSQVYTQSQAKQSKSEDLKISCTQLNQQILKQVIRGISYCKYSQMSESDKSSLCAALLNRIQFENECKKQLGHQISNLKFTLSKGIQSIIKPIFLQFQINGKFLSPGLVHAVYLIMNLCFEEEVHEEGESCRVFKLPLSVEIGIKVLQESMVMSFQYVNFFDRYLHKICSNWRTTIRILSQKLLKGTQSNSFSSDESIDFLKTLEVSFENIYQLFTIFFILKSRVCIFNSVNNDQNLFFIDSRVSRDSSFLQRQGALSGIVSAIRSLIDDCWSHFKLPQLEPCVYQYLTFSLKLLEKIDQVTLGSISSKDTRVQEVKVAISQGYFLRTHIQCRKQSRALNSLMKVLVSLMKALLGYSCFIMQKHRQYNTYTKYSNLVNLNDLFFQRFTVYLLCREQLNPWSFCKLNYYYQTLAVPEKKFCYISLKRKLSVGVDNILKNKYLSIFFYPSIHFKVAVMQIRDYQEAEKMLLSTFSIFFVDKKQIRIDYTVCLEELFQMSKSYWKDILNFSIDHKKEIYLPLLLKIVACFSKEQAQQNEERLGRLAGSSDINSFCLEISKYIKRLGSFFAIWRVHCQSCSCYDIWVERAESIRESLSCYVIWFYQKLKGSVKAVQARKPRSQGDQMCDLMLRLTLAEFELNILSNFEFFFLTRHQVSFTDSQYSFEYETLKDNELLLERLNSCLSVHNSLIEDMVKSPLKQISAYRQEVMDMILQFILQIVTKFDVYNASGRAWLATKMHHKILFNQHRYFISFKVYVHEKTLNPAILQVMTRSFVIENDPLSLAVALLREAEVFICPELKAEIGVLSQARVNEVNSLRESFQLEESGDKTYFYTTQTNSMVAISKAFEILHSLQFSGFTASITRIVQKAVRFYVKKRKVPRNGLCVLVNELLINEFPLGIQTSERFLFYLALNFDEGIFKLQKMILKHYYIRLLQHYREQLAVIREMIILEREKIQQTALGPEQCLLEKVKARTGFQYFLHKYRCNSILELIKKIQAKIRLVQRRHIGHQCDDSKNSFSVRLSDVQRGKFLNTCLTRKKKLHSKTAQKLLKLLLQKKSRHEKLFEFTFISRKNKHSVSSETQNQSNIQGSCQKQRTLSKNQQQQKSNLTIFPLHKRKDQVKSKITSDESSDLDLKYYSERKKLSFKFKGLGNFSEERQVISEEYLQAVNPFIFKGKLQEYQRIYDAKIFRQLTRKSPRRIYSSMTHQQRVVLLSIAQGGPSQPTDQISIDMDFTTSRFLDFIVSQSLFESDTSLFDSVYNQRKHQEHVRKNMVEIQQERKDKLKTFESRVPKGYHGCMFRKGLKSMTKREAQLTISISDNIDSLLEKVIVFQKSTLKAQGLAVVQK